MIDERRTEPRFVVSLEARWSSMSGKHEARICDISASGCFIETVGQAAPSEIINFAIRLPDGEWLELQGEVVFRDPFMGFGVRLVNLSPEDRTLIAQFIEHL